MGLYRILNYGTAFDAIQLQYTSVSAMMHKSIWKEMVILISPSRGMFINPSFSIIGIIPTNRIRLSHLEMLIVAASGWGLFILLSTNRRI